MNIQTLFKKKSGGAVVPAAPQTTRSDHHPFSTLTRYVPLCTAELSMYDAIREAVPLVDAAIGKIVALCGGFSVVCRGTRAQRGLDEFLRTVPVGESGRGMECFAAQHLEQMLLYGTAVGEMLPSVSRTTVAGLYNAPLRDLEVKKSSRAGQPVVCVRNGAEPIPVPRPELILLSALNPKPGEVCGTSLLKGLPFVTDVLLKIFNTVGVNFERVGNVRFAVTYKPDGDGLDRFNAKERAAQIAEQWQKAMRDNAAGQVSDFVAVGDVKISVIGADNQTLDCEVPVRVMLEQIVAKLGIPPFMLGLSWSSTERMSQQQADMLTSELWAYRRALTPVLERISDFWLVLNGYEAGARVQWDNISLQDEVELARAELYRAQAAQLRAAVPVSERKDEER